MLGGPFAARFRPAMTLTFLATLQFDGSGFVGWQRQAQGRSIQGEVERVLERLEGSRVVVHGAGRTDAGVHALAYGASFTVRDRWDAATLHRALNALLPADCWAMGLVPMREGFHARKHATSRRYRYDIGTGDAWRSPFRRGREWGLGKALDLDLLAAAAAPLVGEHDFRAFAVRTTPVPHHRCRVALARWTAREDGAGVRFTIEADRFLHHMVRFLVGTMTDIGLGTRPPGDLVTLLGRTDNDETSPPAPAAGLYFESATYPVSWYAEPEESSAS